MCILLFLGLYIFEIFDDKNKKSKRQEKGKLSGKVTERIKCTLCAQ